MDDISRNIDQQLQEAYLATIYEVKHLGLQLRIGEENWNLEELLIDNNAFSWAFISAWNPFSQLLSPKENNILHLKLIELAKNGTSIIVISQDLDELFEISHRISVIFNGNLSKSVDTAKISIAEIGLLMGGKGFV